MKQLCVVILLAAMLSIATPASAAGYNNYDDIITCESRDRDTYWCDADTRNGVELVDQNSRAPCIEGETWGYTRRGIWVSDGCRGDFAVGSGRGSRGASYGRGGGGETIVCESVKRRKIYCPIRVRNSVQLVSQYSDASCDEDYTWGYDRGGVWVSGGCRGEFLVR